VESWAVGGLFQVGYGPETDFLLVLSHAGRGVFDCVSGKKLARDYGDAFQFFDQIRLESVGFGPLDGIKIRMAGLFGGGLPLTTQDGWRLEVQARQWPNTSVFLTAPASKDSICIGDDGAVEMRACGFSETGKSFIIATSADITAFAREYDSATNLLS
jgi:hypothetical protein